jgi:hypothetical protein
MLAVTGTPSRGWKRHPEEQAIAFAQDGKTTEHKYRRVQQIEILPRSAASW